MNGLQRTSLLFTAETLLFLLILWRGIRTRYFKKLFKRSLLLLPGIWFLGNYLWKLWPYAPSFGDLTVSLLRMANLWLMIALLFALSVFLLRRALRGMSLSWLPVFRKIAGERYRIGVDTLGAEIFVSERDLTQHAQVVGPSGCGKTEGVLFPLLIQAIEKGRASVFVDGKGDIKIVENLKAYFRNQHVSSQQSAVSLLKAES